MDIDVEEYKRLKETEREYKKLLAVMSLYIGKRVDTKNIQDFFIKIVQYSPNRWYCSFCGKNIRMNDIGITGHDLDCKLVKELAWNSR